MSKIISMFFGLIFCVATLGLCNICIEYSDGSKFEWVGWIKRIEDRLGEES